MKVDVTQPPLPTTATSPGLPEPDQSAPNEYLGDARFHWVLLTLAVAVVLLSLVLSVRGDEQVVVPLVEMALPGTCSYKMLFGIDCPGCGLTRCFVSMAHADVVRAWQFNPAGVYLFLVVLFQIPYRGLQLRRLRRGQRELNLGWLAGVTLGLLIVSLLTQWIVRCFL